MKVAARIALWMGVFFLVDGMVYGYTGHEWEGFPLLLMVSGGVVLLGVLSASAVRKATRAPGEELEEPHVGPTIWPFVLALSAGVIAAGLLTVPWLLGLGIVLLLAAGVGWFQDVRRQWKHGHGEAAHDESHAAS